MAVKLYRFVNAVPLMSSAKTVPLPELPPAVVVPYRVLPDKINSAAGLAPSLFVKRPEALYPPAAKVCSVRKAVPSVLTPKTTPWPEMPPYAVVP